MTLTTDLIECRTTREVLVLVRDWLEDQGQRAAADLVTDEMAIRDSAWLRDALDRRQAYQEAVDEAREQVENEMMANADPSQEYRDGWDGGVHVGWEEAMREMTFWRWLKWKLFGWRPLVNPPQELLDTVQRILEGDEQPPPTKPQLVA